MANRQLAIGNRQSLLAWHGWRLRVPREWNPVRLQGGWDDGLVLLADLHRPRLGVRWTRAPRKRFDPQDWARCAIRDEIGQLAAREARPLELNGGEWRASMLYVDPEPPGRDVWVAYSPATNRLVEVVHHAQKRDSNFTDAILPWLCDAPPDEPMMWSIFGLSCTVPAGMKLKSHRLSPGDLSLSFHDRERFLSIRQIAVAKLALSRMPLARWLRNDQRTRGRFYRPTDDAREVALAAGDDARDLIGLAQPLRSRRRYFFMRNLPPTLMSYAMHDAQRDRLILVQASEETFAADMMRSIGSSADA